MALHWPGVTSCSSSSSSVSKASGPSLVVQTTLPVVSSAFSVLLISRTNCHSALKINKLYSPELYYIQPNLADNLIKTPQIMSALFEVFLLTEFFYYGFCFLALTVSSLSLTKSCLTIETIYQIYTFLALWQKSVSTLEALTTLILKK